MFPIGGSDCVSVVSPGDFDGDSDVDRDDFGHFLLCFNGPNRIPKEPDCGDADLDCDGDVDLIDFSVFRGCYNGPNQSPKCE